METVAVVGASHKEERYSNRAMRMLMDNGHKAIPVSPTGKTILDQEGYKTLSEIPAVVDTVTMYLGSKNQGTVIPQILELKPKRVIFNPGTENPEFYALLDEAGIKHQEACTLVLLTTGQF